MVGDLDSKLGADLKAHRTPGMEHHGIPDNSAYRPAREGWGRGGWGAGGVLEEGCGSAGAACGEEVGERWGGG